MKDLLKSAQNVLDIEAQAILSLKDRLGESFHKACELILRCEGKVIVTGIGKSGHIARKISSTLSSTGTASAFLHPAESSHGDLGMISQGDVVIAISYGGESPELTPVLNHLSRKGLPLIAMTGNSKSVLAKSAQAVLDISVRKEACPLELAPTASSTATLAMGDALAMVVMEQKGFSAEKFAENHPGGSLGFKAQSRAREHAHRSWFCDRDRGDSSAQNHFGDEPEGNAWRRRHCRSQWRSAGHYHRWRYSSPLGKR
jgi:arabinose-5-phosphate isomerase